MANVVVDLLIRSGSSSGQRLEVGDELVLGREGPAASLLGDDPQLSRRHARFFRDSQGRLVVEDLGSSNGTRVNGERIAGSRILRPGDRLRLGDTEIEVHVEGDERARIGGAPSQRPAPTERPSTRVINPAAVSAPAAAHGPAAAPPAPAPPPPPPPGPAGPGSPLPPGAGYTGAPARRNRTPVILLVVVLLLAGLGVGGYFLFATGDDNSTSSAKAPSIPTDCGAKLGDGQQVAMVAYVESNRADGKGAGTNSVLAVPYRAGDLKPLTPSSCATGGRGSTDLTDSGVLDANGQVQINSQHTLLFAVNQGSDSIAVFRIQPNGGLQPVPGSPFPSGGKAPAGLGISGSTLVVANKAQDGVRDLSNEKPVYTTLHIESDGRLTQIPNSQVTAEPGSSPTDAYVPPRGGVAFSTEESGPLRSFSIELDGTLKQAPNSPQDIDDSVFAAGFDPKKEFALGIVAHPKRDLVYISMPTVPSLAVYSYDQNGELSFEKAVPNAGAYLPCWNAITPDGKWLYTSNADTNNVTAFDLSDPSEPKQIQTLSFSTPGNPWNAAVDPSGKFLVVNTPRDTLKVPEGEGNTQHVLRIGNDGKLTEVGDPYKLPVPQSANPQGLALLDLSNS